MTSMGNNTAATYLRKSTEDDGKSVGVGFLSHGFPSALRPALVEPAHIELDCENADTPGES